MSQETGHAPPTGRRGRLRQVGPGLLAAATGVGAGDLVATMVAGARFGTTLLWAAVLGTVLKLALAEGVGRWHLASGSTLLDGWRRLGRWATTFFGLYIVVWGFVYGATAMSAVGLPLNALFGGLEVRYWAMIAGVTGLVLVWAQRYAVLNGCRPASTPRPRPDTRRGPPSAASPSAGTCCG
jgi:Mn2+/Fe2+ NRAMP family transporter